MWSHPEGKADNINFYKTEKYDKDFLKENMMGPNSMMILEELLNEIPLKAGMRVLDLGCGNGLTSVFLEKEYGKCPVFLRHGRTGWVRTIPMPQKTGKCFGQTAEDI